VTFGYKLVTDEKGRIQYKQRGGQRKHFHLAVFVDEPREVLDQIRLVEYRLHDTFREPIRHNDERENKFEETFYTWGKFTIHATILYGDGHTEQYRFYLDYSLPPDLGLNYVKVTVG
jgi:transcription initiation factor IIF auxiliary subunit